MVAVGEVSEVVVLHVPKALACESDALAGDLANNGLHHNFVGRNLEVLQLGSNFVHNLLGLLFGLLVVVLLVSEVALHDLFDDLLDLARVESATQVRGFAKLTSRSPWVQV